MLGNYLITALRNLERNRLYAAITILGLAAAFAAAILIGQFVRNELTYDHWVPRLPAGLQDSPARAGSARPGARAQRRQPAPPGWGDQGGASGRSGGRPHRADFSVRETLAGRHAHHRPGFRLGRSGHLQGFTAACPGGRPRLVAAATGHGGDHPQRGPQVLPSRPADPATYACPSSCRRKGRTSLSPGIWRTDAGHGSAQGPALQHQHHHGNLRLRPICLFRSNQDGRGTGQLLARAPTRSSCAFRPQATSADDLQRALDVATKPQAAAAARLNPGVKRLFHAGALGRGPPDAGARTACLCRSRSAAGASPMVLSASAP